MHITIWGTRGSSPITDKNYQRYGGDTVCIEIRSESGEILIIDAGSGLRGLTENLTPNDTDFAILFTHYHLDHIMGLAAFEPLFNKTTSLSLFGPIIHNSFSLKESLHTLISPPLIPFTLESHAVKATLRYQTVVNGDSWKYGTLTIDTISVEHSCTGTLGYRITEGDKSCVIFIDNELNLCSPKKREELRNFSSKANLLIADAHFIKEEYEKHKGWGHSSLEDTIQFANDAEVVTCGFIHYAPTLTDTDIDTHYLGHSTDTTEFIALKQRQKIIL